MKRSVIPCILFLLVVSVWSLGPITRQAEALTRVYFSSPGDSSKVVTGTPKFEWTDTAGASEIVRKHHIKLATDINFTSVVWEDATIEGADRSKLYDGPPLTEWQAYYWTMRVQVDSIRESDTITYWQEDFETPFTFFYTTAILFQISKDPSASDLPDIQTAIIWAASGDTILVDEGTYEENLRFYKRNLVVTSNYLRDQDTVTLNRTVIDGSQLTRGEDNGSVVYFTSDADSFSVLTGFTIRGGSGTKVTLGADDRIIGGGIFCDVGSSPTIAYNVITDNEAYHSGGGIFIHSAAPNILHNIITGNWTIRGSGGGIECYYSIEVEAPTSPSPGAQDGGKREKSRLQMSEEEVKNSLNPRDATQVASAPTPGSLAKPAQNSPPVAVTTWYARKDTIIQRDKYLLGDTLFFDGSGSYDPDSASGDYIFRHTWKYFKHWRCWEAPSTAVTNVIDTIFVLPIDSTRAIQQGLGLIRIFLEVVDAGSPRMRDSSDIEVISIQYPPHADVGDPVGIPPEDTAWLDGSASCDVNPGDTLVYAWTQVAGPPVTLENPDSATTYFYAADTTYLGAYEFQLMVADDMDTTYDTLLITVSRPPIPVCQDDPIYGDTLVGFLPDQPLPLDACASWDPDPGDHADYFLWEPVARIFISGGDTIELPFNIDVDPTLCSQTFTSAFGGLLKLRLRVRDSFGVISEGYDSVLLSVQMPPEALAGEDTILRPGNTAYLEGSATEINPDERNSLEYHWSWIERQSETVDFEPSPETKDPHFSASLSGYWIAALQVEDIHSSLSPADSVTVIANEPPIAQVLHVSHAFEGDTVLLDASGSYDPDSSAFDRAGSFGALEFTWSAKPPPPGAEVPVIVDGNQPVAKFVPYGTGTYEFEVLVNDSISVDQPVVEGWNIATLTVMVDSTYAYPIIMGNLIAWNSSGARGGGIDCNQSSPDIINNILYKNQSKSSGGAIACRNLSTPQIKNNIIFGNISSDSTGGGIADLKGQLAPSATRGFRKSLGIQENCFWDNPGGTLYETSGNISANIDSFPRLIDPDFGDFRMACTSPCNPDIGSVIYFQPCHSVNRLEMVSFSLFQNPVATAVAHFIVNSDVALKAPPTAYVTIGGNAPAPVHFSPISSKAYRGSHVFTGSGDAEISIFASSLLERDTTVVVNLGVQLIGKDDGGTLASVDRRLSVLFPKGSVTEEIYATCISVSGDSEYKLEEGPDLEPFGEPYQLGPSIPFDKGLTLSFPLNDLDLKDKDKTLFAVYMHEDGKWNRQESFLDGNSVCAEVKSLGVYRLAYDPRGKHIAGIPQSYELFQNYPNPFNPETQIRYDLPAPGHVKLTVFNVLGQKVRVLADEMQDAGHKSLLWDGRDDSGDEAASGIYFYKIKTEGYQKTKKMVLLK